jgi:protein-S-isoprenylcysteine O-methyltransferase
MFYAAANFNNIVQTEKVEGHSLVKTGPYSISRHPSYFGWFLWSTGTQLVLSNPICYFLWFLACYLFFSERIEDEEKYLIKIFGDDYIDYALKTPIGIPFVKGNKIWAELKS